MGKFAVVILGHQNSGKSKTWYALFGKDVRTGAYERPLNVGEGFDVDVFLINGSCEESGKSIEEKLGGLKPKIIVASAQYIEEAWHTFEYLVNNDYLVCGLWLNPGWGDSYSYSDYCGLVAKLESHKVKVWREHANYETSASERAIWLRTLVHGWAAQHGLVKATMS